MSYRIWWLIAFCALGIGMAIEMDAPALADDAMPAATAEAAPAPMAAQIGASDGG